MSAALVIIEAACSFEEAIKPASTTLLLKIKSRLFIYQAHNKNEAEAAKASAKKYYFFFIEQGLHLLPSFFSPQVEQRFSPAFASLAIKLTLTRTSSLTFPTTIEGI